jgi:hypothetical protein
MREIKNECFTSGPMNISSKEAMRGTIACPRCGKILKIRANRNNECNIPRHARQDAKKA